MNAPRASFLAPLAVLVACAASGGLDRGAATPAREPLTFAFWNVENLFDADDDPTNPGDDEYLPANEWTAERYATKREHLAEVIAAIDPHLIGFAEVENRRVLQDLFADPRLAGRGFELAHVDSPDHRGIDLAVAFRAPFSLRGDDPVRLHPILKDGASPTRGVLEVRLEVEGHPLFVLVNHWPSRGGDRDGAFRRVAGAKAREVVDRITAEEAEAAREADVLIVGDLNDDPFDPSVVDALGAVRSRNAAVNRERPRALFNPSWTFLGRTDVGTLYYSRDWTWNVFDQAIVSRGMLDDAGVGFVDGSLQIHSTAEMLYDGRLPKWFRKGRGGEWTEGYSDHFPIRGELRVAR